jgi:transcriptional regulator with XRE-family HTH domain
MPVTELGRLLRHWRGARGKSQLDLAIDAGLSQRHLSFVESGRSVPSRETLLKIARVLDVPLRDRNALLLAAGYAPAYPESAWDAAEMGTVASALERMLRQHEPFPAVVMDRYWNVLMANDYAPRLFNCFVDMAARPKPRNLLHLMFDPAGMRPFIINWEEVAKSLFERVRRESVGHVMDVKTNELLAALSAYPEVRTDWEASSATNPSPVIPLRFVKDGKVLSYFSMVATVGTPETIAAQELRLECMFPADDATEALHLELVGQASAE